MRKLVDVLVGLAIAASLYVVLSCPVPAQEPVVPGSVLQPANGNSQAFVPFSASNPLPVATSASVGAAVFTPAQVNVGATATLIAAARTGPPGTGRVSITITNTTTTAIYIGGSGVTTSTGTLLPGVVGASLTINTTAAIYGIVATGTATVTEFETY